MPAGLAVLVAAALLAAATPAPARAAGWTEADYWRFADRMQERLDAWWVPRRGLYRPGDSSSDTMVNANQLLVHSTAALRGHRGPARRDDRARSIAAAMVEVVPFVDVVGRQFGQLHAPGWSGSMSNPAGMQHVLVDAEVAEALAAAWRAREVLALPPPLVAAIRDRLHRVATSPFWRYPAIRLNQLNWHAAVYSAAAEVTGDATLLRRDLRRQVARFVRGIRRPRPGKAGNLGPGLRFHYLPHRHRGWTLNLDSSEYANIVASFTRFWDPAREHGVPRLPVAGRRLLRRWMRRVLAGYWTHSGYQSWDTGFGFRRLHQAKKVGLAQQALLGIAASGELVPGGPWPAWAKRLLDRGFALYERWLPDGGGVPPALLFHLDAHPTTPTHNVLAAARVQANAARAVAAGLGGRPSAPPPALYAFDPDVGRLAVTTPRYSTAILPVNQGAFPYGGIEPARLFDARQDVAGGIGGVPPAAFGLVVRDARGRTLLVTQRAKQDPPAPLRLLEAPAPVGSGRLRAYAGPFRRLRARGTARRSGVAARVDHTFTPRAIETRWRWRGRGRAEVQFPSWRGDGEASVEALLRSGRRVAVRDGLPLRRVRRFIVRSERASYRVVPRGRGVAALVQPAPQSSAPRPGPTLVVRLGRARSFEARIVVAG